jgi:hypothetical protein
MACAPSLPSGVLSEDDMEDVLYDMHVAQAVYENAPQEQNIITLRASVLKKYDISQEEWDSSFNYYCRNADKLHGIYKRLNERIQQDVVALGGKVDGMMDDGADTTNVWKNESAFILMQQSPFNLLTYAVEPDSTFEDGDRLTLQFDVQYIFQDGYRDVTAVMNVYYDNDSISTNVTHVNVDGHGVITVNNEVQRLHVKEIKGYFILGRNLNSDSSDPYSTTLRLAAVRNVKLLHTHTTPPAKREETEKPDSLSVDSLRKDSLIKTKQQSMVIKNI